MNRRISGHVHSDKEYGIDAAIKKYGIDNFKVEVLEKCSIEMLNEREIFWIKELNSKTPSGYNLTDGGDCNLRLSKEARNRMSAAKKGKPHKPHSQKTRDKISAGNKGKHSYFKGKSLSKEHKAKISAARKAWWAKKKT